MLMRTAMALGSLARPDWPDRLGLTASDRRLESTLVLELVSPVRGAADGEACPQSAVLPEEHPEDVNPEELQTFRHAMKIAEFLAEEFGAVTREQKVFVAELAAEVALRISDELP
jgi:hypothetical protein